MTQTGWIESWDRVSVVWAGSLGRACWQGGAALLVVWLLCQGFTTISPTLRAWLWRLAYLKLLLTLLLPPLFVPILPAHTSAPLHAPVAPTASSPVESGHHAQPSSVLGTSLPKTAPTSIDSPSSLPSRLPWTFWLSLLWGGGVVWCLVRVAGEWVAAGWLRGLSEPVQDDALNASCLELSERLGLHKPPRLMVSDGAGSPVLLGGASPAIILPLALLTECSQPELELILAHELAHHTRRDLLWGWVPALGHALFFFFPLEWLAAHEYRLAQEMACDELAIRTSQTGVGDYGAALLKVAARHRPNLQSRLVTVGIAESSQILKRRLLAMKGMGSLPVRSRIAVTAVVGLGLLGCIPWHFTPRALAEGSAISDITSRSALAGQPDSSYRTRPDASATPADNNALRYPPKTGEPYVYTPKIDVQGHPPAPVQPERKPIAEAELTSTLADLQSSDGFKVIAAANKLAAAQPTGDQRAVESALIGALGHKNGFARQSVVKALGTWGDSACVPPLIRRLDDESFAVRWAVFEVLSAKKDVRAAAPIAKWLEKDRGFSSDALRQMGAVAAPAVARQLTAGDWGMHIDVCRLLKEIGTPREIPALQPLTHDDNRLVADAAAEAIQAIRQRSDTPINP